MLSNYVVVDLEMTGLSSFRDKIIEIGAVKVADGAVSGEYQVLVNPNVPLEKKIIEITGITEEMISGKPFVGEILQDFFHFIGDYPIIGHNLRFDYSFLMQAAYDNNMTEYVNRQWFGIDTLKIARTCLDKECSKTLESLVDMFQIKDDNHHRALNDAAVTKEVYENLCRLYENEGRVFKPEEMFCKPRKDRKPSKREIQYVEKLINRLGIETDVDIFCMTQSELSRYADKLKFYNNF